MTGPSQDGVPTPFSLAAVLAVHLPGTPLTAAPTSTLESDMHLVPEQMARSHIENRHREAQQWRIRRIALAARRAEAAERRARLAREVAVLAARESALAIAR